MAEQHRGTVVVTMLVVIRIICSPLSSELCMIQLKLPQSMMNNFLGYQDNRRNCLYHTIIYTLQESEHMGRLAIGKLEGR